MHSADIDELVRGKTADHPSPSSLLGIAIAACVFAVNIYRAAHQSITADEAFTFDWYIVTPLDWFFTIYSANNHVLQTLLSRISVQTLGLSELTFRLPSLLGGLLYLVFVYKVCRHVFKNQWTFLLGMAALTLNPFIMDYLSAARGYGMALGLFMAALYLVIRFLDDPWESADADHVSGAAILLGLSISANLVFLFPAIALSITLTLLRLADAKQTGDWNQRLAWIIDRVWLGMAVPAVLLLAIPLAHASRNAFYFGKDSLRETARSVVERSLFHQYEILRPETIPGMVSRTTEIVTDWIVPLMLAVALAALAPVCWRWLRERDFQRLGKLDRTYFLIGTVFAISLGMSLAAHALAGVAYPSDRTAIYLAALLTFEWIMLIEKALALPRVHRALGMLASAPAAIAILLFLSGFTTSYYYEWRYDAGTKRIFRLLQGRVLQGKDQFSSARQMKVGVTWMLDFSFNFYRRMYHADWLAKVTRDPPAAGGFDYYVLLPDDEEAIRKLGLRVIYRDPISYQELATPGRLP
jgi:hypothetical protein